MQLQRGTRIPRRHRLPENRDVTPNKSRVDGKTSVGTFRQDLRPQLSAQKVERPSQGRATVVFVKLRPKGGQQLVAAEAHFTTPQQHITEKGKAFGLLQNGTRITIPHRQTRGTEERQPNRWAHSLTATTSLESARIARTTAPGCSSCK